MLYKIFSYKNGDYATRVKDQAASYKQSAKNYLFMLPGNWCVLVVGKKAKIYNEKGLVKIEKLFLHRFQKDTKYAIMVMVGNISMTHYTKDKELRDKIWQNMASEFAKPVSPDEQLKNIIVYLDEIEDSKSGSTLKKTSKMSAANVMPLDDSTPTFTDLISISAEYMHLAKKGWEVGSVPSHSKLVKATVKRLIRDPYPAITREMKQLEGKTLVFYEGYSRNCLYALGWAFLKEWLEFQAPKFPAQPGKTAAKVIQKENTEADTPEHGDTFSGSMKNYIGGTLMFEPKEGCPGWWKAEGYNWHESWLEFETLHKPRIFTAKIWKSNSKNPYFTGDVS